MKPYKTWYKLFTKRMGKAESTYYFSEKCHEITANNDRALEHVDCIIADHQDHHQKKKKCPEYIIKQYLMVRLQFLKCGKSSVLHLWN